MSRWAWVSRKPGDDSPGVTAAELVQGGAPAVSTRPHPQAPAPLSVVLVRAGRLKLTRAAGPQPLIPRVWGRPCTSSGFPGGAGAAGQGTTPGRATFVGLRGPLWRHQPCVLQKVKCRQSAAGLAFELYLF